MRNAILFLIILLSVKAAGQHISKKQRRIIKECSTCTWDSSQAKYDIAHNAARLFCCFSFFVLAPSAQDAEFEKEFGVKYYVCGDAPPAPVEKLHSYNRVVEDYLDQKYGAAIWRKKVKAYL